MTSRSRSLAILSLAGLALGTPVLAAETVLHSFGVKGKDGSHPQGELIPDSAGNLYGSTLYGGDRGNSGNGTIFMLTPGGNGWTETLLYTFKGDADGAGPNPGLTRDKKGNLYGTTRDGGSGSAGTVFTLSPPKTDGGKWLKTTLYNFCSLANCADGQTPFAPVTLGENGTLFGTTYTGGNGAFGAGAGTVFQLTPGGHGSWAETVLYNFCNQDSCSDGIEPYAARLLLAKGGTLYGTATKSTDGGDLYALVPGEAGYRYTILHPFSLSNGDGRAPLTGVVADRKGVLYGTLSSGGANGCGAVYAFDTASAAYTVLYSFCTQADHSDGALPYAGVTIRSGKGATVLYGTTTNGSIDNNHGVVFALTAPKTPGAPWSETVLHSFSGPDGSDPAFGAPLEQDGGLFGTTEIGGDADKGTVYRVDE